MAEKKKAQPRTRRGVANKTASKKSSSKTPISRSKKTEKTSKKLKPAKKDTLINEKSVGLPHSVSLSKLNPFRLPVDIDSLAIHTARFAGMFFVAAGTFFTLWHLHAYADPFPQLSALKNAATVCTTAAGQECDTYMDDHNDVHETATGNTSHGTVAVNATPNVSFEVHGSEPLVDEAYVSIFVEQAEEVALYGFHKELLTSRFIGQADRVDDTEWKVVWETEQYEDGAYRLRAVVKNQYGEYDQRDSNYISVKNSAEHGESGEQDQTDERTATTTLSSSDAGTAATSSDGTDVSRSDFDITFTPGTTPLQKTVIAQIAVQHAEEVWLELIHEKTGRQYMLGKAVKATESAWEQKIDTALYPNGAYAVHAHVKGNFETLTKTAAVVIENEAASEVQTTDIMPETTPHLVDPNEDSKKYDEVLRPTVELVLPESDTLESGVDIQIKTEQAAFIEVYAVGKYSLLEQYLGLAKKVSDALWNLRWNTENTPNGDYKIFARVRNDYGTYDTDVQFVSVFNENKKEDVLITQDEKTREVVTEIQSDLVADLLPKKDALQTDKEEVDEETDKRSADQEPALTTPATSQPLEVHALHDTTAEILADFKDEIDGELQLLASTIRSDDELATEKAKERLQNLQEKIIDSSLDQKDSEEIAEGVDARIREVFAQLESSTHKTEAIIKERVGAEISKDTDQDGITDYDEIHIYKTDPNSADSDEDGFVDGAEILNGFNPKDARAEALVTYESPKEAGVTRKDILEVREVAAVTVDTPEDEAAAHTDTSRAVISGRALPNSFVTIYIFSTPIVVTVKTDADGNWNYRFDKEIEDGEHEVYVGVTDNTGSIVAKSEPFRFVKTAQAFTPIDAAASAPVTQITETDSFASERAILVVLSISIVGIGLVLIMLGMHLASRRPVPYAVSQTPQSTHVV